MGLKELHLKLKAFRLRRFLSPEKKKRRRQSDGIGRRVSWLMPVSHGYHVIDHRSFFNPSKDELDPDSILVQREQMEETELWFFGVFDARIGDGVIKYIQTHLFDKKLKESQMSRRSNEAIRKANQCARAKLGEIESPKEACKVGSASAIVIDGEKLVLANMGEYRAVVCRDGEAHQMSRRHQQVFRRHWSHRFLPGMIRRTRVRIKAGDSGDAAGAKAYKGSEIATSTERIDSDTEFVILASTGIWEVMRHQEAVNLIRHLEDPQEAAECLAKEAQTRMSRSSISCLIIRFD